MGWHGVKRTASRTCLARLLAAGVCLLVASGGEAQPNPSQDTSALQLVQKSESLLRSHDARQAKQVLEQAVTAAPENAKAWGLLADAFSQLGLEQDAIRAYDNTLKLRPDAPLALYNLGSLQLRQGRFEEAARCLQSFHRLQPQDKSVLLPLAHCLLSLGRNAEAQATVNELLKASDNDPEVNLKAGNLLLAHGEVQAALKPLGDALQLRAGADEARLMLAMAESQLGRPARVIELLQGHPLRESPLYASLLGSALCDKKDYERAVPLLEEAIRQHTEEKPPYLRLAAAYAGLSKGQEAVQTLQQAHARWPDDVQIRSALARQLFTARDPVGALVVLREAPESA